MTTNTNQGAGKRKPVNFDFEKTKAYVLSRMSGAINDIANDRAAVERYQAFLEEKGLSAAYFQWETQQLNEDVGAVGEA